MKKIYLVKTEQYNKIFYTGSVDARKLARLVDKSIDVNVLQEDQRPLEKGHLLSISKYVGEKKGILPTSVIVGTKDKHKLNIETEIGLNGETLYYMMFPDTEQELLDYENTIDISDGQHRVFSFSDKYRNTKLKDSTIYEIPVTFFITPTLKERQEIFYTVNAQQKAVAPNLLTYLKYTLGIASDAENIYMPLIQKLNFENSSPLKGRFIISAEKITGGYKAHQVITLFNDVKLKETIEELTTNVDIDKMFDIVSEYLRGWENKYSFDFQTYDNTTKTKKMGLNYIMNLLPTFITIALNNKQKFNADFIEQLITDLEYAMNIDIVNGETLFTTERAKASFTSSILKDYINDCKIALLNYNRDKQNQFDPFA